MPAVQARRRIGLAAAAVAMICACSDATPDTRAVTVHVPSECPVRPDAFAVYYAYGDFEPSPERPQRLSEVGAELSDLPAGTRSLVVDIGQDDARWWALAGVPNEGPVDVLAWPYRAPCRLTGAPALTQAATLTAVDARRLLVNDAGQVFVADLSTGAVDTTPIPLRKSRLGASVTPYAGGALIAGGQVPGGTEVTDTAEVIATEGAGAARDVLVLGRGRAYHGATALANGDTVLVGGIGADGRLLDSLEIVDAATGVTRASPAALRVPRRSPTVLRLASGRVLVVGGIDADGQPVTEIEWFSPDATNGPLAVVDLGVASAHEAFVTLPAGGALAVVAPDPAPATGPIAHVIREDFTIEHAPPVAASAVPKTVKLFAGSLGAPVLWDGAQWLRWDPWGGTFAPLPDSTAGSPAPTDDAPAASPDPGLATWLAAGRIVGFRFDVRGPYATDLLTRPLLLYDTSGVAPDRLVVPAESPSLHFDAARGLSLSEGASAFVADATFGDIDVDLQVPAGALPRLILRDEAGRELDVTSSCALSGAAPTTLHAERRATVVRAKIGDAPLVECAAPLEAGVRVSVGVRAASGAESVVRALTVTRR